MAREVAHPSSLKTSLAARHEPRDEASHRLVPERVVITTELDPFLPLRALAAYAGLSVRTLRQYLDLPPDQALPCYRVGGKILVRRSEFDAWVAQYQFRGRPELARTLREIGLDNADV
jgi:excisionase family DNA binding protein